MATITREQAHKRQAQAPQGWIYDWKHYVVWGDNQLVRDVNQKDGSVIRGTISFREIYKTITNEYGCRWNQRTGEYAIELHVARWTKTSTEGVWSSFGLGKGERLGLEAFARRNYKDLCKYAATITDEMIMSLYENGADLQLAM